MSTVDLQISSMREALAVRSDAQLAKMIGYTPANVSAWRSRGSIPEAAVKRFEAVQAMLGRQAAASRRVDELGKDIMQAGLQLVLWLAPSRDAVPARISPMRFTGIMLEFTSLFNEIHLSAAEEIAACMAMHRGLAPDQAFASLTEQPFDPLYDRILARAREWRGEIDLDDDD